MSEENKNELVKKDIQDLAFPELTQAQLSQSLNQLVEIMPEHGPMLQVIKESIPEVHRASSLFYKTQSQFMDNMLTVSHMTPLRNLRQILAQMTRTRSAIKESHHKLKKKEIELDDKELEIEMLERRIDNRKNNKTTQKKSWLKIGNVTVLGKDDDLTDHEYEDKKDRNRIRMLEAEIAEIKSNAEDTRGYISGAIRQLTNYTEQFNEIKKSNGIGEFNEADFEKEEPEYHIKKAFEQALCAARTRIDKTIDEGNMIYLTQIGINGAHAQMRVTEYLKSEQVLISEGKAPTHRMFRMFLDRMAEEFSGSAEAFSESKGMKTMTETALIDKGDTRLLQYQNKKEEGNKD